MALNPRETNRENAKLGAFTNIVAKVEDGEGEEFVVEVPSDEGLTPSLQALSLRKEYDDPAKGTATWSGELERFKEQHLELLKRSIVMEQGQKWDACLQRYEDCCRHWLQGGDRWKIFEKAVTATLAATDDTCPGVEVEMSEFEASLLPSLLLDLGFYVRTEGGMGGFDSATQFTLFGGKRTWKWLFATHDTARRRTELQKRQSEVRANYHKEVASNLVGRLESHMRGEFGSESLPSIEDGKPKQVLRDFINQWRNEQGARPFIQGLRRVLEEQQKCDKCLLWELQNDVFTQSGGEKFIQASVSLLHALDFRPRTPVREWQFRNPEGQANRFTASPLLTNMEFKRLMQTIPPPTDLDAPHGKVTPSIVERRPREKEAKSMLSQVGGLFSSLSSLSFRKRPREEESGSDDRSGAAAGRGGGDQASPQGEPEPEPAAKRVNRGSMYPLPPQLASSAPPDGTGYPAPSAPPAPAPSAPPAPSAMAPPFQPSMAMPPPAVSPAWQQQQQQQQAPLAYPQGGSGGFGSAPPAPSAPSLPYPSPTASSPASSLMGESMSLDLSSHSQQPVSTHPQAPQASPTYPQQASIYPSAPPLP